MNPVSESAIDALYERRRLERRLHPAQPPQYNDPQPVRLNSCIKCGNDHLCRRCGHSEMALVVICHPGKGKYQGMQCVNCNSHPQKCWRCGHLLFHDDGLDYYFPKYIHHDGQYNPIR